MPCIELVERVTDYLEGALDQITLLRLREHLRVCTSCEEYINEVRLAVRVMSALSAERPSPSLEANLLAIYRERTQSAVA
jgi:predicted anti-sigma-YlaC factor YlaD